MQYFTVLAALFAGAMASPMALDSPIAGYRIETLQWSIQMGPGHFEVLNGTIQEVMAQAREINPNFEIPAVPEAEEKRSISPTPPSSARLNKRAHEICGIFPSASKFRIQEGISYLNRLPAGDRPLLPPGPGACGRVSCSYNSAIWWCNDNRSVWGPGGWEFIAQGAQKVIDTCARNADWVSGQAFDDRNWNTIVRGDSC
ncbi:hypothetical protein MCOR27_004063 [Pyricularia oryzae]|uniref:Uncharacterized protein n=2 Tax=Pyricularia TaxID=48558 RepID=A0ABQ8NP80_PYRGI|nr:hypothetical protein MCOR01_009024 [Pyricularia oryzae]KAI6299981.1 hypothetical protein MCOR33_004189 [Pyricularia grisea]KAI6259624.1 hypothetical protein MCOR19_004071 [Pyricularia oryzae]KAI6278613.1 hypothetical protein MCOR26_004594 [Pyricularia oryzae]KAI6281856.1 hypothetical protein MCOR27_004063 [Pyricularia oryzae]